MKALVVGGTGPTGPHLLRGLIERGYETAILHRGVHEPSDLPDVRHIHADPHFEETLKEAVGSEEFDVIVATYGRLALTSKVLAPRCGQFVGVSGTPVYLGATDPYSAFPSGMRLLTTEDGPTADQGNPPSKFATMMVAAERASFEHGVRHGTAVTSVRYPMIYGARTVTPWEWTIVRRVLDGRRRMILPDSGLWAITRCAARNAAEILLLIVDQRERARGQSYNCADEEQFSLRQIVELVLHKLGSDLDLVDIPSSIARSAFCEWSAAEFRPPMLIDASKARQDLGYRDVVSGRQALEEVVEWMIANPITTADYPTYRGWFDYALEDRLIDSWNRALGVIQKEAPDLPATFSHPMPHPKKPSLTIDERGR